MSEIKAIEHPTLKVSENHYYFYHFNSDFYIYVSFLCLQLTYNPNNFILFFYHNQVPYEILNKKFRITQKTLDRELNAILQYSELEKGLVLDENSSAPLVSDITLLLGNKPLFVFIDSFKYI